MLLYFEDYKKMKKMGRVLMIASVASMIDQFVMSNIILLKKMGYDVDTAANFREGNTCTKKKVQNLKKVLKSMGVNCYQIDFDRKVTDLRAGLRAFRQLDHVLKGRSGSVNEMHHPDSGKTGIYSFVHIHSPIGGVIGRIVAKKNGIRTIYTAHGFHFYTGAPKVCWLFFYPVEKGLSWFTDVLITINREDFMRARRRFHAKKTVYIPGIGLDIEKYRNVKTDRNTKRKELGIENSDIMLLSVGELNENKNHKTVIEALGQIQKSVPRISGCLHYFIAGRGCLHQELARLAERQGVQLHLLGFRDDVPQLLKAADIFLLPSRREGLNVGLMEAMASGLPCIVSDIRGNRDLIQRIYRVPGMSVSAWRDRIVDLVFETLLGDSRAKADQAHETVIQRISLERVLKMNRKIYEKEIFSV